MLQVAGCSDTNLPTGTFPGPPLNMSPPVIHTWLKRGQAIHEAGKLNVNYIIKESK
jgi:hypothetical protein